MALHANLVEATSVDIVRIACANAERAADGTVHGPAPRIVPLLDGPNWRKQTITQALVPGVQMAATGASWPPFSEAMLALAVQWSGRGASGHVLSLLGDDDHGIRFDIASSGQRHGTLRISVQEGRDKFPTKDILNLSLPAGQWLLVTLACVSQAVPAESDHKVHTGIMVRSAICRATVPDGVPRSWTENWVDRTTVPVGRPSRIRIGTLDSQQTSADVRLDLVSILPAAVGERQRPAEFAEAGLGEDLMAQWERALIQGDVPACLLRGGIGKGLAVQDLSGTSTLSCVQRPYTAARGLRWDGRSHSPIHTPSHYTALHLNSDTLLDAHWTETLRWDIPIDLPSGCYAFRLGSINSPGVDFRYATFFVSAASRPRNPIAVLIPTFSYLAYSNAIEEMRGPVVTDVPHPDEIALDGVHPAYGRSLYERHPDGQSVQYCSSRRPMLSVSPSHRPWQFVADTWLLDWLERAGHSFDVITDHDLHGAGMGALEGYAVVVTGHHPEYWTTSMWDGLWTYLNAGGRMLYLGGNGLYWRTAFDESTDAIEVRRAEDGTRPSIATPGEYYCAFTGEYGGLWRRLGRPPQQIVGVGMAAQGFDHAAHFRKAVDADAPEVAFVFDGVAHDTFGHTGWLGGGASGWEIDRIDVDLGTPEGHWWLARSDGHAPSMLRTKEELLSFIPPFRDAKARSDVALTPVGPGDVFAVGSMTWVGSLHGKTEHETTDVAKITGNVIRRFLDPTPIPRKPPKE